MSFYGDYLHWLLVPEMRLQGILWTRGVDYRSILRHLRVLFCTTYLFAIHRSSICQLNRNTDKSKNRNSLPTCTEASQKTLPSKVYQIHLLSCWSGGWWACCEILTWLFCGIRAMLLGVVQTGCAFCKNRFLCYLIDFGCQSVIRTHAFLEHCTPA